MRDICGGIVLLTRRKEHERALACTQILFHLLEVHNVSNTPRVTLWTIKVMDHCEVTVSIMVRVSYIVI